MNVSARLVLDGSQCRRILLTFPVAVQLMQHQRFSVKWGDYDLQVSAVSRLTDFVFELFLEKCSQFPIFKAGKYESFPGDSLSKITVNYDGAIRDLHNREILAKDLAIKVGL